MMSAVTIAARENAQAIVQFCGIIVKISNRVTVRIVAHGRVRIVIIIGLFGEVMGKKDDDYWKKQAFKLMDENEQLVQKIAQMEADENEHARKEEKCAQCASKCVWNR